MKPAALISHHVIVVKSYITKYKSRWSRTVFFHQVADTVSNPAISPLKHAKKCVFGVFLNHTRIALVCKN